jgi:hypothetical protein
MQTTVEAPPNPREQRTTRRAVSVEMHKGPAYTGKDTRAKLATAVLKILYGLGYWLKCEANPNARRGAVVGFLDEVLPEAVIQDLAQSKGLTNTGEFQLRCPNGWVISGFDEANNTHYFTQGAGTLRVVVTFIPGSLPWVAVQVTNQGGRRPSWSELHSARRLFLGPDAPAVVTLTGDNETAAETNNAVTLLYCPVANVLFPIVKNDV